MILTLAQLQEDNQRIVDQLRSYSADLHTLVDILSRTGCREGEVLDRDRWSPVGDGSWILLPQKFNAPREIKPHQLNGKFRAWLESSGYPYQLSSLVNLRRSVEKFTRYPIAYVGEKRISTHRFRHAFIKDLAAQGLTPSEIQSVMGLSSKSVVLGYIGSSVTVP